VTQIPESSCRTVQSTFEAVIRGYLLVAGNAKTNKALPEFGRRISGASSGGISVVQLPPPTPAGIATYCLPLAVYVIGNPCAEVGRRVFQRIFPEAAS